MRVQRDDAWLVGIAVVGAMAVGVTLYDAVTEGGVVHWLVAAVMPFAVAGVVRQNRDNRRRRGG